jgi:hypothetical protein
MKIRRIKMIERNVLMNIIIDKILTELKSRSGFDNWWYDIDEDIRDEICLALAVIVSKELYENA